MESTSSFLKSVTKRVWSPVQRPFRVCCHNREIRKGITAGTLEELKERGAVVAKSQDHNKPRNGKDIARVTFDLYKMSPKDLFGSLSVKATFQGLYSVSADFQCLGPKKVIREALRVASTLLQAAGHLLITSASLIRRVIEGAEFWQPQRAEYTARWN
ncbi:cell death activator CIDE-B [Solea senegalensis]|uniref:Cell death activator CIDE-B n=1 Tax=Solea senegalensis TaxID=28829 RepID=A0AAV6QQ89_SOLSE|nr:cell death activator CIDE-B [Solea senegalensis]